jgi:hypothetical protein
LKRNTVLWYLKAGYRLSALAYALASISLAWMRAIKGRGNSAGRKYRQFLHDLGKTYQSMLFSSQPTHCEFPTAFGEKGDLEIWQ